MSEANGTLTERARSAGRLGAAPTLIALAAAGAWSVLWLWSTGPHAGYLDHGSWLEIGMLASLCRALPAGEVVLPAVLHVAAWLLMIAAMMLPSIVPLLALFRRVSAGRADAERLLWLLAAGYALAWLAFGLAAHALDALLLAAGRRVDWFVAHGWIVGASVIGAAGLFQFSALKYRCLDKCRTPYGFIIERWRGRTPRADALRIGFDHGLFCIGCCWALMLIMFVVGMGNVGWMLAIGAVMAIEKNLSWGKRLSAPLGIALIAWAGTIVAVNLYN